MEIIKKRHYPRDVFFNNGLVNFYLFYKEKKFNFNLQMKLTEKYLELTEDDEVYSKIFTAFIKNYKIIRPTDKKRLYFDKNRNDFILEPKYEIIGASSGNDIKNSYITKTVDELGLTNEKLQNKYLNFCLEQNILPELKSKIKELKEKPIDFIKKELGIKNKKLEDNEKKEIISYLFDNKKFLNIPNGDNVVTIYSEYTELIKNAVNTYFVKENPMKMDSKIHQFETKIKTLFDMLKSQPNYHKINKWEALIYWFGGRVERYFSRHKKIEYILLPNSSNLKSLYLFKKDLDIPNESIKYRNKNKKLDNVKFFL